MKKFVLATLAGLICAASAQAWFRSSNSSHPMFSDTGDRAIPFTVDIGSTTPVQIYTANSADREITIQNPSASYVLYVSTASTLSASTGPRFLVPKTGTLTINCRTAYWGLYESSFGSGTGAVVGVVERDSKD